MWVHRERGVMVTHRVRLKMRAQLKLERRSAWGIQFQLKLNEGMWWSMRRTRGHDGMRMQIRCSSS